MRPGRRVALLVSSTLPIHESMAAIPEHVCDTTAAGMKEALRGLGRVWGNQPIRGEATDAIPKDS